MKPKYFFLLFFIQIIGAQNKTDTLYFNELVSYKSPEIVNENELPETKCYAQRNIKTMSSTTNNYIVVWNEKNGKAEAELSENQFSYPLIISPNQEMIFNLNADSYEYMGNKYPDYWLLSDAGEVKITDLKKENTVNNFKCKYYQVDFEKKKQTTSFKICVDETNPINNAKIFSTKKYPIKGLIVELENNKSMERLIVDKAEKTTSKLFMTDFIKKKKEYDIKKDSILNYIDEYYSDYEYDYPTDSIAVGEYDYGGGYEEEYINESYKYENQPNYCKTDISTSIFENKLAGSIFEQYIDNACKTYKTTNGFINKTEYNKYLSDDLIRFKTYLSTIKDLTPKDINEIITQMQTLITLDNSNLGSF